MYGTTKFWMRLIGLYKSDLSSHYGYSVSNAPEAWTNISLEKAIECLKKIYFTMVYLRIPTFIKSASYFRIKDISSMQIGKLLINIENTYNGIYYFKTYLG